MTYRPVTPHIPVTLIAGDGIGNEIVDATLAALAALRAPFDWDRQVAGRAGMQAAADPLPQRTLDSIRRTRLVLKGPLASARGAGHRSCNVQLREEFKLYANLRPTRTALLGGRFHGIDLVVVRENWEGLYIDHEDGCSGDPDRRFFALASDTDLRNGCRRLLRYAFEYAVSHGRKKVTLVHQTNHLTALTGPFLETGQELYQRNFKGEFEMDTVTVDACALKMVQEPWQFDVLVTTNLFGDVLADIASALVGGVGMAPGSYVGADAAIFEAMHGTAPDIAGKGVANPVALMLASAMLLDHCALPAVALRLRKAINDTLNVDNIRTRDVGGSASTEAFTRALVSRIENG